MFGYVLANSAELTPNQQRRYRAFYCGLCHALGKRCGKLSQLTLSYDMVFLAMLLSGLYEPESAGGSARCPLHPTKRHDWLANSIIDYTADMSVLLTYYNLLDKWEDDKNAASLAAAKVLAPKTREIARRYPRQSAAIHHCLSQLHRYEQTRVQDLELAAGCFGNLMASLFCYRQDFWQPTLCEMAGGMGKFIYLLDAYEDLPKDRKSGSYNPWLSYADRPDFEEHCREVLTLLMAQAAAAFEKLPILQDQDILRNIIYSGIWTRYQSILEKKNRRHPKK